MSYNRGGSGQRGGGNSDSRYPSGYNVVGGGGAGNSDMNFGFGLGQSTGASGSEFDAMFNTNQAYEALLQTSLRSVDATIPTMDSNSTNFHVGNTTAAAVLGTSIADYNISNNFSSQQQHMDGSDRGRGGGRRSKDDRHNNSATDGEALVAAALEDYYKDERNVERVEDDDDMADGDVDDEQDGGSDDVDGSDREDEEDEVEAPPKKKRRKRTSTGSGKIKKVDYPFKYFTTLEERFISKQTGKEHQRLCICKFCQMEYEELNKAYKQKKVPTLPPVPRKVVRSKRDLIQHLNKCQAFTKFGPPDEVVEAEEREMLRKYERSQRKPRKARDPIITSKYHGVGDDYDDEENSDEYDDEDDEFARPSKNKRYSTSRESFQSRPTRDRSARFKKVVEQFPYMHFITLNEKFISKSTGKQNNQRLCICKYCSIDYEKMKKSYAKRAGSVVPDPPRKIMRAKRDLDRHLKHCLSYRQKCRDDYLVHYGRDGASASTGRPELTEIEQTISNRMQQPPPKSDDRRQRYHDASAANTGASSSARNLRGPRASTGGMTNFSSAQIKTMQHSLLEFLVDNDLDMRIVENRSFQRFITSFFPGQQHQAVQILPRTASDALGILQARGDIADEALEKELSQFFENGKNNHRGGLVIRNFDFDGGHAFVKGDESSSSNRSNVVFRISAGNKCFVMNLHMLMKQSSTSKENEVVEKKETDLEGAKQDPDTVNEETDVKEELQDEINPDNDVIAVARSWEHILVQYKEKYRLSYLVANESKWFPEARRILALRHPHVIFNRCWAHQILIVMTKSLVSTTSEDGERSEGSFVELYHGASAIVRTIKGSSKWLPLFQKEARDAYGKACSVDLFDNNIFAATLFDENPSWWSTTHSNLASLLRVKGAIRSFASKHETLDDFPDVFFQLNEDDFWSNILKAEQVIRPFCDVVNILRQNGNSMANVMFVLLHLTHHLVVDCKDDVGENNVKEALLRDLECRWKREENALFFLAFALHPSFRDTAVQILKSSYEADGGWMTHHNALSIPRLVKAGKFYYEKFRLGTNPEASSHNQEVKIFAKLLWQWLSGKDFDVSVSIPNENAVDWWDENGMEMKYLSDFAKYLLDAPVQTATCEELFQGLDYNNSASSGGMHHDEYSRKVAAIKEHLKVVHPEKSKSDLSWIAPVSAKEYEKDNSDLTESDITKTEDLSSTKLIDSIEEITSITRSQRKIEGISELDCWTLLYNRVVPKNDAEEYFNEDTNDISSGEKKQLSLEGDGADDDSEDDDPYEVQPNPLPPLLDVKQAKYPQENRQYFNTKKYVRNDKYALQKMTFVDINLPSLAYFINSDI
jgi:hypothetical protein